MSKALRRNPEGTWQSPGFPFHHLVVEPAGKRVHISGQVAWDKNRNVIGQGDAGLQTKFALNAIRDLLNNVGSTMQDIVSLHIYYVNQADYAEICSARNQILELDNAPASTAVRVAGLVDDNLLVEISAIAVIPSD